MRSNIVDEVMLTIPENWRHRWCKAQSCACMGCVQVGNRLIMAKETTGHEYLGDPEYIDVRMIPDEIYKKYKITKEEWENWMLTQSK